MSAANYPVTFGYLEKWGEYTHRGEDRAMPTGTPVIVGGTQIGLSGNTGLSSGPHLHLQVGKDFWAQQTIKPSAYWFKGEEVVQTGTASQWGNYVIVKYQDVYCVYAHLSKIQVKLGQKLGGGMATDAEIKKVFNKVLLRNPDSGAYSTYRPHDRWFVFNDVADSQERKNIEAREAAEDKLRADQAKQIQALQASVTQLSTRPTKAEMDAALAQVAEATERLTAAEAEIARLKDGEDTTTKNLVDAIKAFFSKWFK